MRRRDVLSGLAGVGSLPLAGCASVPGLGESGTVLGTIAVVNFSLVPNRIHLLVVRGEETLLDREIGLTAIDADDAAAGTVVPMLWGPERGEYTIHAHHVGDDGYRESNGVGYTFTGQDYEQYYGDSHEEPGCIAAVVTVGTRAEEPNAPIGIGPTRVESPCGTSPSR